MPQQESPDVIDACPGDQEYRSHESDGDFGGEVGLDNNVAIEYTDDFPENVQLRKTSQDDVLQNSPDMLPQVPEEDKEDDGLNKINELGDESDEDEQVEKVDLSSEEFSYLKRDPEEEFFMLAVLSQKMIHTESYDDAEYVYELSAAKLFRQVRDLRMPFHQWYKWLEDKFGFIRIAFMAQLEEKEQKERERREQAEADAAIAEEVE